MGGLGVEEGGKKGRDVDKATIHVKLGLSCLRISQNVCVK